MFELLAKLFTRTLKKFQNAENENEKKSLFFKVIFYIVCALVGLILYIPPGISFVEALGSVVVFIFINLFSNTCAEVLQNFLKIKF